MNILHVSVEVTTIVGKMAKVTDEQVCEWHCMKLHGLPPQPNYHN